MSNAKLENVVDEAVVGVLVDTSASRLEDLLYADKGLGKNRRLGKALDLLNEASEFLSMTDAEFACNYPEMGSEQRDGYRVAMTDEEIDGEGPGEDNTDWTEWPTERDKGSVGVEDVLRSMESLAEGGEGSDSESVASDKAPDGEDASVPVAVVQETPQNTDAKPLYQLGTEVSPVIVPNYLFLKDHLTPVGVLVGDGSNPYFNTYITLTEIEDFERRDGSYAVRIEPGDGSVGKLRSIRFNGKTKPHFVMEYSEASLAQAENTRYLLLRHYGHAPDEERAERVWSNCGFVVDPTSARVHELAPKSIRMEDREVLISSMKCVWSMRDAGGFHFMGYCHINSQGLYRLALRSDWTVEHPEQPYAVMLGDKVVLSHTRTVDKRVIHEAFHALNSRLVIPWKGEGELALNASILAHVS